MRIGGVPYGVGAPLLHGLDHDPHVEFRREPPTKLAVSLRDGSLDVALVSSIEGFRRPGYRAVGGLGIASRGAVRSVRAFVKRCADVHAIRTVAVDNRSATSVTMLKILLHRGRVGAVAKDLEFIAIEPTAKPDDLPHDAVLMIGDRGLNADPGTRRAADLGELWDELTGLPMVYAIWLINEGVDAEPIVARLHEARRASLEASVDDGTGGAIHYELDGDDLSGLARFHAEAAALDLADPAIAPEFLSTGDFPGENS